MHRKVLQVLEITIAADEDSCDGEGKASAVSENGEMWMEADVVETWQATGVTPEGCKTSKCLRQGIRLDAILPLFNPGSQTLSVSQPGLPASVVYSREHKTYKPSSSARV